MHWCARSRNTDREWPRDFYDLLLHRGYCNHVLIHWGLFGCFWIVEKLVECISFPPAEGLNFSLNVRLQELKS